MNTFKVTRDDWSLVRTVLALSAIVPAVPVVGGLVDWFSGKPLVFDTIAVVEPPAVNDPGLTDGVTGVYTGQATYTIPDASPAQWLAALAPALVTFAVIATAIWLANRLVRNARADEPFQASSLRATRVLGILLFTYGLFQPLIQLLSTAFVSTPMRGGEFNIAFQLGSANWWPIVIGLLVGVIGEVAFGRGKQLTEDTEGLI